MTPPTKKLSLLGRRWRLLKSDDSLRSSFQSEFGVSPLLAHMMCVRGIEDLEGARVFLALGSQHLVPFYSRKDVHFIVRMVDAPRDTLHFEYYDLIAAMPGVTEKAEQRTIKTHRISHLVCRNSGGKRGYTKIAAARQLGVPIFMIERPGPVC